MSPLELVTAYGTVLLGGREVSASEALAEARRRGCVVVGLPDARVYRVRHGGAAMLVRGRDAVLVPAILCEDGAPVYYEYLVVDEDTEIEEAEEAPGLPLCPWVEAVLKLYSSLYSR